MNNRRLQLKVSGTRIVRSLGGWLIGALLGGLAPACAHATELRDPAYFFDRNSGNMQQEAVTARWEGKRGILIMFDQRSCPPCTTFATTVLNQPATQDFYRKYFRILRVDINSGADYVDFAGKSTTARAFAGKYRIEKAPIFMFFDLNGNQRLKYTGITYDPGEFIWLGEFVVQGAYKSKTFTAYKYEKMHKK